MKDSVLNTAVSSFRNYNTPSNPKTINLLDWLNSKEFVEAVEEIRKKTNKEERDVLKASLPAITPSGVFHYRRENALLSHSGIIQVDIDFKSNAHISNYYELKKQLCNIDNVAYCGLSVSGTGYYLLIPIAYPEKHRQHFDYLYEVFKKMGINIDEKPRNVSSLRGISNDPDAYINHHASKLEAYKNIKQEHKPKATTLQCTGNNMKSQVEAIINEIIRTQVDLTFNYSDWLSIGFAFASEFGETGRQFFHDVSQFHHDYKYDTANRQFSNCLRSKGHGITIATLFHLVKKAGISLPECVLDYSRVKDSSLPRIVHPIQETFIQQPGSEEPSLQQLEQNKSDTIRIRRDDVIAVMAGISKTGNEYNNIIIGGFKLQSGEVYDVLKDSDGRFIVPGEQSEVVSRLSKFFEKDFRPALLDDIPCLVRFDYISSF